MINIDGRSGVSFGRYATPAEIRQYAFYDGNKPADYSEPKLCFVWASESEQSDNGLKGFLYRLLRFPFGLFLKGFQMSEDYARVIVSPWERQQEKEVIAEIAE